MADADTTPPAGDAPNYLEMSDEDLLKSPPPPDNDFVMPSSSGGEEPPDNEDDDGQEVGELSSTSPPPSASTPAPAATTLAPTPPPGSGTQPGGDGAAAGAQPQAAGGGTDPARTQEAGTQQASPPAADPASDSASDTPPDYEAEYKRLMAPFRANGREVQARTVEEAIQLMQMGAGFNRKMVGLKPNLKYLKLLEKNGLLDEEKLGFLVDLSRKDPAAISKLISDSGIDPMDLDATAAAGYKPKTQSVNDKEIELDSVLDELQDSPTYNRTLDVVGNLWDAPSRQIVADHPGLLRVINDHIQRGIYDVIVKEVERSKMLGQLQGLSDLDAYRQVGDALQERRAFDHLGAGPSQAAPSAAPPAVITTNPAIASAPSATGARANTNDRKRAAAPNRASAPSATLPSDFNPLSLSDAEFEKMATQRYS